MRIDLGGIGGSALTDSSIAVPEVAADRHSGHVRSRAQHRDAVAARSAGPRCSNAPRIFIGVNAVDYSGYPDCRPAFVAAFERVANLATKAGVEGTTDVRDRRRR